FVRALSLLPLLRRGVELDAADTDDPLRFTASAEGLTVEVAFASTDGAVDRVAVGPPLNAVFHRRSSLRSARVRWRAVGVLVALSAAGRDRRNTIPSADDQNIMRSHPSSRSRCQRTQTATNRTQTDPSVIDELGWVRRQLDRLASTRLTTRLTGE